MLTAAHFCSIAGEKADQTTWKGRDEKNSVAPKIIKRRVRSDAPHTHSHCEVQKDFCLCSGFFGVFYLFLSWGGRNRVVKAIFTVTLAEASASGRQKASRDRSRLFFVLMSLLLRASFLWLHREVEPSTDSRPSQRWPRPLPVNPLLKHFLFPISSSSVC